MSPLTGAWSHPDGTVLRIEGAEPSFRFRIERFGMVLSQGFVARTMGPSLDGIGQGPSGSINVRCWLSAPTVLHLQSQARHDGGLIDDVLGSVSQPTVWTFFRAAEPVAAAPPPPPPPPMPAGVPDLADVIARRGAAIARHEQVRARWPGDRADPDFAAALNPVAGSLDHLQRNLRAVPGAPPAEIARTIMAYGDALFDLARAGHVPFDRVLRTYLDAEPFVKASGDARLIATHDGTYAAVLMKADSDPSALRIVIARCESALRALGASAPASYRSLLARARAALAQHDARAIDDAARDPARSLLTRRERVAALALQLRQHALAESFTLTLDPARRERLAALGDELTDVATQIRGARDAEALELERKHLRRPAAAVQRTMALDQVSWIEPLWPVAAATVPDRVHVAGDGHRDAIVAACEARRLAIAGDEPGRDPGEAGFLSLCRATLAVIDLGRAATRASACYQAGLALVLGKPLVVIGDRAALPVELGVRTVADAAALGDAIDRALILPLPASEPGDPDQLLAAARVTFAGHRHLVDELARHRDDPLELEALLEHLLLAARTDGSGRGLVTVPAWTRRYPDRAIRRVFHAAPFAAAWTDDVTRRVRASCETLQATYRRAADARDPGLLSSRWDELTAANRAIVDLTDLHLDVVLALGVLDALGTPTLLVGQPGTAARLPPSIPAARLREHAPGTRDLEDAVAGFLTAW